jgi:uncharacterized protein
MDNTTAHAYNPTPFIAQELQAPLTHVQAVVSLLQSGSTVPFIARYRKEATGGMDEVNIRTIEERYAYLVELENRRTVILASIKDQGKLTPLLEQQLQQANTKAALEDLYLPYKPKRRTRGMVAKEKGLQPLAEKMLQQPLQGDPLQEAQAFVCEGVDTAQAALNMAQDIVAEHIAEHAQARAFLRETLHKNAYVVSVVVDEKKEEAHKFAQYTDFKESVATIPSHRFLAIRRGEREGFLRMALTCDEAPVLDALMQMFHLHQGSPWCFYLQQACTDSYHRLLFPSVETDVRVDLKMKSDKEAVEVFASNLKHLLLAAPLGEKPVLSLDPGIRTGCKMAVLDATGKFLYNNTLYISQGEKALQQARLALVQALAQFQPRCIAVGNGTAGRETEAFVRETLAQANITHVMVVSVNESGASVYSASDVAREEFPDMDVTVRGAVSIGRRLQDPLAELVKIDPKSIGVGQYQHDVNQTLLAKKLDEVVESCVNHVGVELNTASASLLSRVAGIGETLAKRIVQHREQHGAFTSRAMLREVPGLGPKTFEQAAGFIRIRASQNPLDASAVHPERYALVENIARTLGVPVGNLVGNTALVEQIDVHKYVSEEAGLPTLTDIVSELKKPGRDPRETFEAPVFRSDVFSIEQLNVGMDFEGVVTNVTAFGAFVDIGVHQDGLVHISELSHQFVQHASAVVKVGDKIKVKVLDVDVPRKRISLSCKQATAKPVSEAKPAPAHKQHTPKAQKSTFSNNPFAALKMR